jgi:hypothetical protein
MDSNLKEQEVFTKEFLTETAKPKILVKAEGLPISTSYFIISFVMDIVNEKETNYTATVSFL